MVQFKTKFYRYAELKDETYAKMALLDFKFNLWDTSIDPDTQPIKWYVTDTEGIALFSLGGFFTAEEAAIAGIKHYTTKQVTSHDPYTACKM